MLEDTKEQNTLMEELEEICSIKCETCDVN